MYRVYTHTHTHKHTNIYIHIHIYSYMNRMVCSWPRLYNCICYFCFCCRKSRLRKQRSFLAQSDLYSREAEGRAEAAVHVAALVRRQRAAHWACSSPISFSSYLLLDPHPWATGFREGLSTSVEPLCFLGNSKSSQVEDNEDYPPQPSYTNTSWCRFPPALSDCFGVSTVRTGRVSEGPLS